MEIYENVLKSMNKNKKLISNEGRQGKHERGNDESIKLCNEASAKRRIDERKKRGHEEERNQRNFTLNKERMKR